MFLMSSQYAVAPVPALQVKVAELPLMIVPGGGVCITPKVPVPFSTD
jgi:hypothetical protein